MIIQMMALLYQLSYPKSKDVFKNQSFHFCFYRWNLYSVHSVNQPVNKNKTWCNFADVFIISFLGPVLRSTLFESNLVNYNFMCNQYFERWLGLIRVCCHGNFRRDSILLFIVIFKNIYF